MSKTPVSGPANPTGDALAALHPLRLDQASIDPSGLFGRWQARNATATLPHILANLETAGNLANLRRVVSGEGDFKGMWFADSDIYKASEAALWELGRDPSRADLREAVEGFAVLCAEAQDEDGYLNSLFQTDNRDKQWKELRWSHELYCAGHLIQAAVAAVRVGEAPRLVEVARKFADLLVTRFGREDAICGHPEIETALVEFYRVTGHRPYLDLAAKMVDLRGNGLLGTDSMGRAYYQDHTPVRAAKEVTGHVVRQLYLLAGAVDVAVENGDTSLLAAAGELWESAYRTKTYITGGQGSRHRDEAFGDPYELPPDRAYAESCAAIASFHWNWRMLLATGQRRYADAMEQALYNGIASCSSLDGKSFFYSNPLQLRTGHDGSNEDAPSQRLSWYSCSCCPPNLARLIASLHGYLATTDDSGLQFHLYGAGSVSSPFGDVTAETGYPWAGRIRLAVHGSTPEPWTLALRIPDWCTTWTLTVDGTPATPEVTDGYVRLTRTWETSTVELDLDLTPTLVAAHPHVDAVRGCLAVTRGPLVYCLEQADLSVPLEDVRVDPAGPLGLTDPDLGGAVGITLTGALGQLRVTDDAPAPLYGPPATVEPDGSGDAVPLTAIPYFLWGNRNPGPMRVWIPTT